MYIFSASLRHCFVFSHVRWQFLRIWKNGWGADGSLPVIKCCNACVSKCPYLDLSPLKDITCYRVCGGTEGLSVSECCCASFILFYYFFLGFNQTDEQTSNFNRNTLLRWQLKVLDGTIHHELTYTQY